MFAKESLDLTTITLKVDFMINLVRSTPESGTTKAKTIYYLIASSDSNNDHTKSFDVKNFS